MIEPLPWPGNPRRAIDDTNRGKYFFEVHDAASGRVVYSRGFSSIYGEWETTAEAKAMNRTFSESLRFPAPDAPVRIVVRKRDAKNVFQDAWTVTVDPKDKFIDRSAVAAGALMLSSAASARSRTPTSCPTSRPPSAGRGSLWRGLQRPSGSFP